MDKIRILELAIRMLKNESSVRMDNSYFKVSFMCVAIESAASELGCRNGKTAIKLIPELLKYKPEDKKQSNAWFPVKEREKRINILKEILEDLKK